MSQEGYGGLGLAPSGGIHVPWCICPAVIWLSHICPRAFIHKQVKSIREKNCKCFPKTSHSVFNFKYFPKTSFCEKVSAELLGDWSPFHDWDEKNLQFYHKKKTKKQKHKQQQQQQEQHGIAT